MLERYDYKEMQDDRNRWFERAQAHEATIADLQGQLKAAQKESFGLAATQCSDPLPGEYGHMLCGAVMERDRRIDALQQRVVQLEGELSERKEFIADCDVALDRIQAPRTNEGQEELVSTWRRIELLGALLHEYRVQFERHFTLQADHAHLLGLVRTACERWRAQTNAEEGISFRMAMKELEASLPAQPAQGGAE